MKEIVVASGKGGTGKTFISSNLAYFLNNNYFPVISVDADAENPDLLLSLGGSKKKIYEIEVRESKKAKINYEKCIKCLKCLEVCRFNAIELVDGVPRVIRENCEGCGACKIVCPVNCIEFEIEVTGRIRKDISKYDVGVITTDLEIGGRNTGELIYLAKEKAREEDVKYSIIDCAPGIGCPVVSSLAGADMLIVVIEPTPSSFSGAMRLLKLASNFDLETYAIINKSTLNKRFVEKIREEINIEIIGEIPYNEKIYESYSNMIPLLAYEPESSVGNIVREILQAFVENYLR